MNEFQVTGCLVANLIVQTMFGQVKMALCAYEHGVTSRTQSKIQNSIKRFRLDVMIGGRCENGWV